MGDARLSLRCRNAQVLELQVHAFPCHCTCDVWETTPICASLSHFSVTAGCAITGRHVEFIVSIVAYHCRNSYSKRERAREMYDIQSVSSILAIPIHIELCGYLITGSPKLPVLISVLSSSNVHVFFTWECVTRCDPLATAGMCSEVTVLCACMARVD